MLKRKRKNKVFKVSLVYKKTKKLLFKVFRFYIFTTNKLQKEKKEVDIKRTSN